MRVEQLVVFGLLVIAVILSLPGCTSTPRMSMIEQASSVGCEVSKWNKRGISETIICFKPIDQGFNDD